MVISRQVFWSCDLNCDHEFVGSCLLLGQCVELRVVTCAMVSSSVPVTPSSPACTLVVHGVELILSPSCSEWLGAVVAWMARCAGWLALAQCALCRKKYTN